MVRKTLTLNAWLTRMLRETSPRSKSLIITLFGDSLHPYVSTIWLADLMRLLEPFGVNAQLTRTSAFRLTAEHWLSSKREGRSSRYSLTPSGVQRVEHAYHRIYDPPPEEWDGSWTLVLPTGDSLGVAVRADLRRELEWSGWGGVAGKLFLHPRPDLAALWEIRKRLGLTEEVAVLRGRDLEGGPNTSIASLTSKCWNLGHVSDTYARFLDHFRPVLPLLMHEPNAQAAFLLQTLVIHSFRRIVLHDPRLPAILLPANWPGHAAYTLCGEIYRRTWRGTLAYLNQNIYEPGRKELRASPEFLRRLGGLG